MPLKPTAVSIFTVAFAAALAACGGGSSSSTPAPPPKPTGSKGTFVDEPVVGLTYSATPSGLAGVTDATGTFTYKPGDTVTFSLGVGSSVPAVNIGSTKPLTPTSGNAQVFVLSLQGGLQLAQVLQSLDHGKLPFTIDVSGLSLSSVAVANLNAYTSSGGTQLPAGQTDVQMLAAAEASNTAPNITFRNPGGASVAITLNTLVSTITNLNTVAGVNLSTVLSGATVFSQQIHVPNAGALTYNLGFVNFNASGGTADAIVASQGPVVATGTWAISGNTVNLTQNGVTDSLLIAYLDASQALWPDTLPDGSFGSGTWIFVQTTFAPASVAGKTLTLDGFLAAACNGVPIQLVIDGGGANFTSNCKGSTTPIGGGPIAAVASLPGILSLTDTTSSKTYYLGLPTGSSISNGTIAVAVASTTSPGGGLTSVTAQ